MSEIESQLASAQSLQVGVIQANLGVLEKRTQAVVSHRRHVDLTQEMLRAGPLDLIIWPETAYTRAMRGPLPISGRLVQSKFDTPLLFGATLLDQSGPDPLQFNAALLVGRDGLIRDAYRKNLLIPIAESIPFEGLIPGSEEALPHAQHFQASSATPPLRLDDWRISVPICYEAVRPSFVRKMIRDADANLLVSLANDAWFGDSQEPVIHLQLARMRAIEHRLYLVRATNSGISAIVDPLGHILSRTEAFEAADLRGTVHLMSGATVYGQLGDWPGPLGLVVLVYALIWSRSWERVELEARLRSRRRCDD